MSSFSSLSCSPSSSTSLSPPSSKVLHFTPMVRTKESRQLTLHNKSSSLWLLQPAIDGEYWSGPETLRIEPGQARHYELTYHPLTMTTDSQKHQVRWRSIC